MRLSYLLFILAITISSCSLESKMERKLRRAERKIEKLTIQYPQLIQKDTLRDTISFITKEVRVDTSFIDIVGDTTYIYRDKLRIKYVKVGDTVHVDGTCKGDTIIRFIEVPFERIVVRKQGALEQIKRNSKGILITLLLFVLLVLIVRSVWKVIK